MYSTVTQILETIMLNLGIAKINGSYSHNFINARHNFHHKNASLGSKKLNAIICIHTTVLLKIRHANNNIA